MREFQISCLPLTFYDDIRAGKMTVRGWSELAKEIGFDAIDINAFFLKEMPMDQIRILRRQLALPVHMATQYTDFTSPDPAVREQQLEMALDDIERLEAIGARYYRPTAGQWYEDEDEAEAIEHVAEAFEVLSEAAQKAGMGLLMENHSVTVSWPKPDFVFDTDRFIKTWDRLKRLPVGINYDTANAWFLEDHGERLLDYCIGSGFIETLHINDWSVAENKCSVAGEGDVDIAPQLAKIFDSGYKGWITIEDVSFQGADGMRRALANVKRLCREAQVSG